MGASLVIRVHPNCDRATLQKWANEVAADAEYEHGHSYSGEWNMKYDKLEFVSTVFDSVDAAENYIDEHNDKHGGLTAVQAKKVLSLAPAEEGAKAQALQQKISDLFTQERNFSHNVIRAEAAKRKSVYKACDHCGSKIHVQEYLKHCHGTNCPVCNQNLLVTPTHETALQRIKDTRAKAEKALDTELAARRKKLKKDTPEIVWVVGGWCAS